MILDDVRRLELAGLAAWRAAEDLRQVRERFPAPVEGDRLEPLLRELEATARTVAGEVTMRLRDAAGEAPLCACGHARGVHDAYWLAAEPPAPATWRLGCGAEGCACMAFRAAGWPA